MPLNVRDQLEVWKHFFRKWTELLCAEIDRDIEALDDADEFNEVFLAARWAEVSDRMMSTTVERTPAVRMEQIHTSEELDERWALMCKHYAKQIGATSSTLPTNIEQKIDAMKRRVASDYERAVKRTVDEHSITSPIEQLFLLEWLYQRASDKCDATLHPQEPVRTSNGTYTIDFVIRARSDHEQKGAVAIELDGHDFHEKTKQQVANDKKRERAIVRTGLPVLRFSGHGIWKDTAACVREVVDYFRPKKPG